MERQEVVELLAEEERFLKVLIMNLDDKFEKWSNGLINEEVVLGANEEKSKSEKRIVQLTGLLSTF